MTTNRVNLVIPGCEKPEGPNLTIEGQQHCGVNAPKVISYNGNISWPGYINPAYYEVNCHETESPQRIHGAGIENGVHYPCYNANCPFHWSRQ